MSDKSAARAKARREAGPARLESRARSRARAEAAVAAETAKLLCQRHILNLGDRAVEVVCSKPGAWHLVTDGQCGPVLSPAADPDGISGMPAADPDGALIAELSQPLGLSAAELERMVPGRAPGTCASCRLPLTPGDGAAGCTWCLALHDLMPRPRPPAPAAGPSRPAPWPWPLLAAGGCYWAAWHWPVPFGTLAAVLAVVLFVTFISRVARRAVR